MNASRAIASPDGLEREVARLSGIGACWSPSFSPDGSTLAFVSDLNGAPQIWTVPPDGGWPRLVTAHDDPVGRVRWSPAGEWLAYSVAPGGGMNQQIYLVRPDGRGSRRLTDGGGDNNWLGGWNDTGDRLRIGSSRRSPETVDAWVYDMRADALTLLAENAGIGFATDLSRDGTGVVLWRQENRSSSDLWVRDLRSGHEHLLTPHEGPGDSFGGEFSPDGRSVRLITDQGRDRAAFGRVGLAADGAPGPIELVAARDDAGVEEFAVTHDGGLAALLWNAAGRTELELIDLGSLKRRPVPGLPGEIVEELSFSSDGRRLALTVTGAARPHDIWLLDVKSGQLRQLTHAPHPGIDLDSLVRPELVRYPAHDGLELSGWLYRPRGVAEPAPYVLSFHGGPEGQERPDFCSRYQALLARGIGVFAPNVRGSAGFGKRFANLDNGALRYDAIRDIGSTVGFLVERKIAAPKRIGIMGGSYGGYMTMAGLAWYPELFAAGANECGIVNFETFFAGTEPWMAAISTVKYGDPLTQAELLRGLSPIHGLDRVTAPTLVLHGANDTNVPVAEAEQVVEGLRARDVPVEYALFPDEGHGLRKTKNRISAQVSIVRWFERHL